jgi:hypothetical protein
MGKFAWGGKKGIPFSELPEEEVIAACKAADHDKSGTIDKEEFKEVMGAFGYKQFKEDEVPIFKGLDKAIVRSVDARVRFSRSATARTTDCHCFAVFLIFWIGMLAIAGVAFTKGDPSKLLYGEAWHGATCGKLEFKDKPYTYYPRLEHDVMEFAAWAMVDPDFADPSNFATPGDCVSSCPKKGDDFEMAGESYYVNFDTYLMMGRCFPDYPKNPHYFAKCERYPWRNATSINDIKGGSCTDYMREWGPTYGGDKGSNCSIVGDFLSVTCLTEASHCQTFQDGLNYDPISCCKEAMALTYPLCVDYITGSGT